MNNNITYYAIISYVIIIILLFILKPDLIYDKDTQRFKEFGMGESKSLLTFPILAIIIAILIYLIFNFYNYYLSIVV